MKFKHKDSEFEMESNGLIEKTLKVTKHKDAQQLKLIQQQHEIYKERLQLKMPEEPKNEADE